MAEFTNIKIEIENSGIIETHFVYNKNTDFNDLFEFLAYYYPEKNLCPCFKFRAHYLGNDNEYVEINNDWKFKECMNKFIDFHLFKSFECNCIPEYKDYYKKSKKYIINNIILRKKNEQNIIKMDNNGQIIGNKYFKQEDLQNFYDVIIDIKSIKSIEEGWKIKMSERVKEKYENFKSDKVIKIGVIGNSNKGKSLILSKISKITLPSGTSIRTEGLSIKYPEIEGEYKNRKIVLLDSAGLETQVLKDEKKNEIKNIEENDDNEKNKNINLKNEKYDIEQKSENEFFKEKSREKLLTEIFLQNYIIHNSDILIIVVGILTYTEQKLLNRIRTEIRRAKINRSLFIIHNLMTYTSIDQVKDYIDNYLLKSASFNLEKRDKISTEINGDEEIYFYEKNSEPKIYHFLFANEGSEAGDYYNRIPLQFIENEFQRVTDLKPFDVIETVKERFIEISKEILEKKDKPLNLNDFDNSDKNLIKLKEGNIVLKKCLIDELGFSNLKTNGFEPAYNVYKKDDKIKIRLEGPGNCNLKSSIEYSGEYTIIRLNGIKKKDKEPEKLEDNLFNSREFGLFSLDIPLKTEEYLIKNEEPSVDAKKGVMIIEYKLDLPKNKNKDYMFKEEEEI